MGESRCAAFATRLRDAVAAFPHDRGCASLSSEVEEYACDCTRDARLGEGIAVALNAAYSGGREAAAEFYADGHENPSAFENAMAEALRELEASR